MTTVIHEQIKILVELQKIDSQIYRLKKELESQPAIKQKIETDFEKKKSHLKAAEDELKSAQLKQKEKEGDLQSKEEKIKKLQAQLYQAQKMESVGQLAGGVAHDFNNMLSVILGYSQLALEKTEPSSTLRGDLQEILDAALRSVNITRQLLAFSRRDVSRPRVIDLNTLVANLATMLRRVLVGLSLRASARILACSHFTCREIACRTY